MAVVQRMRKYDLHSPGLRAVTPFGSAQRVLSFTFNTDVGAMSQPVSGSERDVVCVAVWTSRPPGLSRGLDLRRCFPQAPPLGSRAEGGGLDGEIAQRQRTSILCHAGFVVTPAQTVPSPVCLSVKVLSLRTALARSNTGVADKQEGQVGIKWWLRWRRSTCPRPLAPSGIKDPRLIRRPRRCLRAVRMGASLMPVISDSL